MWTHVFQQLFSRSCGLSHRARTNQRRCYTSMSSNLLCILRCSLTQFFSRPVLSPPAQIIEFEWTSLDKQFTGFQERPCSLSETRLSASAIHGIPCRQGHLNSSVKRRHEPRHFRLTTASLQSESCNEDMLEYRSVVLLSEAGCFRFSQHGG